MDIKRQTLQHDFAPEWLKLPNQVPTAVKSSDQLLNRSVKQDDAKNLVIHSKKTVNGLSRQESWTQKASVSHNGLASGHHVHSQHGMKSNKIGRNSNQVNDMNETTNNVTLASSKNVPGCLEQNFMNFERETNGFIKQRSLSGVLDDIGNRNVNCIDSLADENISSSVDEEFPSLVGDKADFSKPASSRVLSVWGGSSRECSAVNLTISSGEKVTAVKTPPQKLSAGKRAASDLEMQSSTSKTMAGLRAHSRRMTVLSASKDRQKEQHQQPPLSLMTSVSKVITRELEDRKSNYMKLVRRESQDCNGDGSRIESCHGSTVPVNGFSCQNPVVLDDGQNLSRHDDGIGTENDDMISSMTSSTDSVMMFSDEDERRLLCSMGWEESKDEENYELTEAEIAEVINMIKEKQTLNGQVERANGCSKFHQVSKFTFDNRSRPQSTTIH